MGARELKPLVKKVTIELIPAIAEDLKELDYYKDMGPGQPHKKVMKLRAGIPFWLLSPNTGEIEPHPYRLTEQTNSKDIARYLNDGTIFISKDPFKI